jgi:formylglycine-generating enzyme required for sulfatase activity
MRMNKFIPIGMLSRVVRLCCGKTNPQSGGASVKKASARGSAKTDKIMANSIGMKLAWIPLGTFQMGSNVSDDEKPIHTVKITNDF